MDLEENLLKVGTGEVACTLLLRNQQLPLEVNHHYLTGDGTVTKLPITTAVSQ